MKVITSMHLNCLKKSYFKSVRRIPNLFLEERMEAYLKYTFMTHIRTQAILMN